MQLHEDVKWDPHEEGSGQDYCTESELSPELIDEGGKSHL